MCMSEQRNPKGVRYSHHPDRDLQVFTQHRRDSVEPQEGRDPHVLDALKHP
jgi:hypothetical protein